MLRYASYDIVFQEVPDEVTLAVNITGCPNRCKGCHSPYLMEDNGEILDEDVFIGLLRRYGSSITCVGFMGGDASPAEVDRLAAFIKMHTQEKIKTAWYSGKPRISAECTPANFNYIKTGPYIECLGGLDSPATNQRFYRIDNSGQIDITSRFQKK